jgi:hypothetical protein
MLSVIFYLENPLHLMDPAVYVTAHHSDATACQNFVTVTGTLQLEEAENFLSYFKIL